MNSSNENWFGRLLYVSDIIFCCFVWFIHLFFHSFIQQNHLNQLLAKCAEWMAKLEIHLKYFVLVANCEKNTDIIYTFL